MIHRGIHFLGLSAQGAELSAYHLEARIAYWHCQKDDTPDKWVDILQLYDQLLLINYSPAVALNRAYAFFKVHGRQAGLAEVEKLKLDNNHFYFLLLGELYSSGDRLKAKSNFQKALALAKTAIEKKVIQERINRLV